MQRFFIRQQPADEIGTHSPQRIAHGCQSKSLPMKLRVCKQDTTSTASDPPGRRVAARKLLVNNASRLDCSSIKTI